MRKICFAFVSLLFLAGMAACENKVVPEKTHDDAYYAASASISSNDPAFLATDEGGEISFAVGGGTAVVNVDCEIDWAAENHAADIFDAECDLEAGTLTITASQNTVEQAHSSTITLYTVNSLIRFATITVTQAAYEAPELGVGTSEWHAPAVGALSTLITVDSSIGDFSAETDCDWLTVETSSAGLTLTAAENTDTEERSAEVTLIVDDGIRTDTRTIAVTQDGRVYLTLGRESADFFESAGSLSVSVESNFDWDFSYDSSNGWFTAARNGDALEVSVIDNETSDTREGSISLTAGDGAENVANVQIPVTQTGLDLSTLILVYTTTASDTEVTLLLDGTVDCTVYWGDDSLAETVTTSLPTHTYADAGEYEVRVSGTVTALNSYNLDQTSKNYLTAVRQWGNTGLTSLQYAFYYCQKLASVPADTTGSFSEVTTLFSAFSHCTGFRELPEGLLEYCTKVTTCENAFTGVGNVKEMPAGLMANCSSATVFKYAVGNCTNLKTIPPDLFANCSAGTDFTYVFSGCSSLTEIPEGLFDGCISATAFTNAFYDCKAVTSIGKNLFANCPHVTTFAGAFYDNWTLTELPEGLFSGCSEVYTFFQTFYNCNKLTTVPADLFSDCPTVTNVMNLFSKCASLTCESPYSTLSDGTKVHLYERNDYPDYFTSITSHNTCFYNCTDMADYDEVPSGWK